MKWTDGLSKPGVLAALGAALLLRRHAAGQAAIALGQPMAPRRTANLGAGLGMAFYRLLIRAAPVRMARVEIPWLAGAVTAGGVIGPVLLMVGLSGMPASGASRHPSSLLSKPK